MCEFCDISHRIVAARLGEAGLRLSPVQKHRNALGEAQAYPCEKCGQWMAPCRLHRCSEGDPLRTVKIWGERLCRF